MLVDERVAPLRKVGRVRVLDGALDRGRLGRLEQSPEDLLPSWLRFVRGVVDSEDLPLNISRETMQDSALMRKLSNVLAKRAVGT